MLNPDQIMLEVVKAQRNSLMDQLAQMEVQRLCELQKLQEEKNKDDDGNNQ